MQCSNVACGLQSLDKGTLARRALHTGVWDRILPRGRVRKRRMNDVQPNVQADRYRPDQVRCYERYDPSKLVSSTYGACPPVGHDSTRFHSLGTVSTSNGNPTPQTQFPFSHPIGQYLCTR